MRLIKEVKVVALDEILQSFRTRKILYVLAVVIVFFVIMHWTKMVQLVILVIFRPENILPVPLLVSHLLFYIVAPLLAAVFGFELISGEVQNHTMRFLASRFSRKSIIIGKYLGTLFILMLTIFIVLVMVAVYSAFTKGEMVIFYPFLLLVFLTLYAAAFLSLVFLISAATSKSSITLYLVLILFTLLLVVRTKQVWISPFTFFNYSLSLATIGLGMLKLVLFAGLFTIVSALLFERRDL